MGKQPPRVKELFERMPPANLEAEQGVLGGILLDNKVIHEVMTAIDETEFYREGHRVIYHAMLDLFERGDPIDLITLVGELNRAGKIEKAGGAAYIAGLPDVVPAAAHAGTYAKTVHDKALLRSLIATSQEIAARAYEDPSDVERLLSEAYSLSLQSFQKSKHIDNLWRPFHYWTSKAVYTSLTHKEDGKSPLYETELPVDYIAGGLRQSSFNVIAGRPGTGKTALALFLAGVLGAEREVLFASLEMGGVSLAFRALAHKTGISSDDLYAGIYELDAIPIIKQAARTFDNSNITFRDGRMTLEQLRAGVAQHPEARVLIVDYLQLLRPSVRIFPREAEVAEISATLTALSAEQNLCVIALAQLNRAVDGRQDRRPRIGDLRESGAIEQDADQIWLLYRPKKYKADAEDVLEIIVGKNRHGKEGIAKVKFSVVQGFESETSIYKTENEEEEKESDE